MAKGKQRGTKQELKLKPDHGWRAKPGHKIFVANGGAVRFDFPANWFVQPGESGSFCFHDRQPPADDCRIEVSVMQLNPALDWKGLPIRQLFEEAIMSERQDETWRGEPIVVDRPDIELMWFEVHSIDPGEKREAFSRAALARRNDVVTFITMDYWPEHSIRFSPVWEEVLRSLTLGVYIQDPTKLQIH